MKPSLVAKLERKFGIFTDKRLVWAIVIGAWLVYLFIIQSFQELSASFPSTIIVTFLVLITGGYLGSRGGLVAGIVGLLVTIFSYSIFGITEYFNPVRLILITVGYLLVGGIAGRLHDLGQRLKQELSHRNQEIALRKEIEDALRESEKRYRDLFELGSDALFIIQNDNGTILKVNDTACKMYGYSYAEMLTKKNTDMSAEPEETKAATQSTVPVSQVVNIPLRWHRKKDGTVFPVEITARFISWWGRLVHIAAIRDITERHKAEEELERLATLDPLTGLWNRRHFFSEAEKIFTRSNQPPYNVVLLMLDIDHFKAVNDQFGHSTGDTALQLVAKRLKDNTRPNDIIGRFGGEEFTLILPRTTIEEAEVIAGRLCTSISATPIHVDGIDIRITISMGVAALDETTKNLDTLLRRADQALYAAKEAGRNGWMRWHPSTK